MTLWSGNRREGPSAPVGAAPRPPETLAAYVVQIEHRPQFLMYVKHLEAGAVTVTFKREEAQVFATADESGVRQVNEITSKWPGSPRASYVAEGL